MRFRNNKLYKMLIVILLFISIGYAVLNTTLSINGKFNISKNIWDVHFENVKVANGSVEAVKIPTIENNTTVDFEVELKLPGDYYEFTIDVLNNGTIDAMIGNVIKTPDLTDNQKKYIDYIVEYQNEEEITKNQLVNSGEYVRIKVKVEYKMDLSSSDLPTVSEILSLGLDVNCVQADERGISVKDNGTWVMNVDGPLDKIGTVVTIGTENFYTIGTDGENVKLLSMYNLFVGGYKDSATNTWVPYGDEATGMQDKNMLGDVSGITSFSSNTVSYEGSLVEGYVNDYKKILESKFGLVIEEARLTLYNEFADVDTFDCVPPGECSNKYPWFYSTSYWTCSVSGKNVYIITSSGFVNALLMRESTKFGVRPIIIVSKSQIMENQTNLIEFSIGGSVYYAEKGMTWREWVDSKFSYEKYSYEGFEDDRVSYRDSASPMPFITIEDTAESLVSSHEKNIANNHYYLYLDVEED